MDLCKINFKVNFLFDMQRRFRCHGDAEELIIAFQGYNFFNTMIFDIMDRRFNTMS